MNFYIYVVVMHPPSLPSSSSPPLSHRVPPSPHPNRPHPHLPCCACPGRAWQSTIAMGWATSMITLSSGARPTVGIYLIGAVVAAVAAEVSVIVLMGYLLLFISSLCIFATLRTSHRRHQWTTTNETKMMDNNVVSTTSR